MLKKSLATAALALTALTGAAQADDNAMTILMTRISDDFVPTSNFYMGVDIYLPGEIPTAQVGIGLPNGQNVELQAELDDPGVWYAELDFTDFATMKAAANGPWTIGILGASGVVSSTFTVNLTGFEESNLFPIPVITSPTSGQTYVPKDVTIQWNDPTGGLADVLVIESDDAGETLEQGAMSIDGNIALSATNWKPPVDLVDGMNELAVSYFDIDQSRVTPIVNFLGNIVWGAPPINTPLIPGMPALVIGSENIIAFEVGVEPEPVCFGDTDEDGAVGFSDLLNILSAWGCEGCPEDIDESGVVDFGDLLGVLSVWGTSCDA